MRTARQTSKAALNNVKCVVRGRRVSIYTQVVVLGYQLQNVTSVYGLVYSTSRTAERRILRIASGSSPRGIRQGELVGSRDLLLTGNRVRQVLYINSLSAICPASASSLSTRSTSSYTSSFCQKFRITSTNSILDTYIPRKKATQSC